MSCCPCREASKIRLCWAIKGRSSDTDALFRFDSADPYKASAYIDQDDAMVIARRARQIRTRISQMGILDIVLNTKKRDGGGDQTLENILTGGDAWKRLPLQPTKIEVRFAHAIELWHPAFSWDSRKVLGTALESPHDLLAFL